MTEPHWIEYVKAFGPAIIAAFVAYIAYYQWRLAQANLRERLFDRRMNLYERVHRILGSIMSSGVASDEVIFDLGLCWRESRFLFGTEIPEYIEKIRNCAIDIQTHRNSLHSGLTADERSMHVKKEAEHKKWLVKQFEPLAMIFMPYLGFGDHK